MQCVILAAGRGSRLSRSDSKPLTPLLVEQEGKGREAGQIDILEKDEGGLQSAVRQEGASVELWQSLSVECHHPLLSAHNAS